EVFQSVAEGIERCDHLRPRVRECVHVRPLGDDAIRAFPSLDHVHMTQARPRGVNLLVGFEEFLLTSGLHSKTHGVEGSHGPHPLLWMDYLTPSLCSCRQTGARPTETGSPVSVQVAHRSPAIGTPTASARAEGR